MHPMLLITSETEGLVYINGAFIGEVRPEAPMFRPVSAYGSLYLEYKPLVKWRLPLAVRAAFSAGRMLPESAQASHGLSAVLWPFGITEIELTPDRIHTSLPSVRTLRGAGNAFQLLSSPTETRLEFSDGGVRYSYALPDRAKEPVFAKNDGLFYVSGETEDGESYLLALSEGADNLLLSLTGREISFLENGRIAAIRSAGNAAGHLQKTVYVFSDGAFHEEESVYFKNPEAEFRPMTPEEVAVNALECAQLGLQEEACACFAGGREAPEALWKIARETSAAGPLRFTPPSGRSAVAAFRKISDRFAEAVPVYYEARLTGGEWKLDDMRTE